MMKKLSRIALLAAASAFMLAVFPACGDDDSGEETPPPVTDTDDKEQDENGGQGGTTATFTFLSGDYTDSSTAANAEGFFDGSKDGSLAVTVSAIELQLYKENDGWTPIDASKSSTKKAGGGNMGEGNPASVQAVLTTKSDGIANQSNEVFGENGYEMGRIKLAVTTGTTAVELKKISGYFASGKSFTKGYVKVGDNAYVEITETTALANNKGFSVDGFEVNQTIPASSTKDVYILLGKVATSAPSAGTTIDVAKLVYEFAAAEN